MEAVQCSPGNGADLDFRGVLEGCTAAIVAAAPVEGTLLNDGQATLIGGKGMNNAGVREAFGIQPDLALLFREPTLSGFASA